MERGLWEGGEICSMGFGRQEAWGKTEFSMAKIFAVSPSTFNILAVSGTIVPEPLESRWFACALQIEGPCWFNNAKQLQLKGSPVEGGRESPPLEILQHCGQSEYRVPS